MQPVPHSCAVSPTAQVAQSKALVKIAVHLWRRVTPLELVVLGMLRLGESSVHMSLSGSLVRQGFKLLWQQTCIQSH